MSFLYGVYNCVAQEHDLRLVALAALICCLGVGAGFALTREAIRSRDVGRRRTWIVGSTVATGSSIWATHFLAMLAFDPGLPFRLDVMGTLLSYGLALGLVGAGTQLIVSSATSSSWVHSILGGALSGLAISAMHYTGMNAYQVQGHLSWDPAAVLFSVAIGLLLPCLSVLLSRRDPLAFPWQGLALFVLAICLDHFVGMSALSIDFDPRVAVPAGGLDKPWLVVAVTNVALVIVGLSLAAVWIALRDRRHLAAEELRLRSVADIAVEGLLICSRETIVTINRSLERILDGAASEVIGLQLADLFPGLRSGDVPTAIELDAQLRQGTSQAIPVRVIAQRIEIGGKPHTVIAVRDQRERLLNEARLMQVAREDTLTGTGNRLGFNEALSERFSLHRIGGGTFALLLMDLDRFKGVNDTFGHPVGDELLRRVARRLGKALVDGGKLFRLGGDEFAIIVEAAGGALAVGTLAGNAVDLLSRPFIIDGNVIEIAASVGIAIAPADGEREADLSRNADLALYRAKEEGGGTYLFFEAGMNAAAQTRRAFEFDFRRALSRQEFVVYYQPQVEAATGALEGAEALVRWNHPERGMVPPNDFIPLAEELGLIGALGEWVLRTACEEAIEWPSQLSVAVNLSPIQLRDRNLSSTVASILAETGLPGPRLELEITEGALMQEEPTTYANLHALRALGVHISMDDFGTGYSSLSHLRRFPFDKIKIDRSFIAQVPGDADSVAIVQAIASLGSKLRMHVTVEGVETEEQMAFVVAEGCDQIQGFLTGRPIPAGRFRALAGASQSTRSVA